MKNQTDSASTQPQLPSEIPERLIDLRSSSWDSTLGKVLARLQPLLDPLLAIDQINSVYLTASLLHQEKLAEQQAKANQADAVEAAGAAETANAVEASDAIETAANTTAITDAASTTLFYEACLQILAIELLVDSSDLEKIPSKGPLIVVANHPFGGIEGVILGYLIKKIRPDVKIMGNFLLNYIVQMQPDLITVDPFGGAASRNIRPIKEAIKWVKDGGALICFPAGEVSSLKLLKRRVMDPAWSPHVAAIARKSEATVVPIWFSGRNSTLFQLLGLIHPRLRTAMLVREMMNKKGCSLRMGIGKPLNWKRLQRFESNEKLSDYLRLCTYFLRNRPDMSKTPRLKISFKRKKTLRQEEIIAPTPQEKIVAELLALPADALLHEQGDLAVYIANFQQIPHIMQEIGRLREITFRKAQEGTGLAIDLDQFDHYYLHIFLWCKSKQEIVGAYRIGQADKILEKYGAAGLYSSTLFHFKPLFLEQLQGALEMGRSFIRQEYQRKPQSLPMLWRGIGEFTVRNPHYSVMFGPVSIGQDYHDYSKGLMIEYLKKNNLDSELSRFVKARTPVRAKIPRGDIKQIKECLADIDDVSMMISELEADGRGIPILLRHYLKLSGTLISFNLDRDFSDAIDGLILVDLTKTQPKLLKRFQGEEGYEIFTAYRAAAKGSHYAESSETNRQNTTP